MRVLLSFLSGYGFCVVYNNFDFVVQFAFVPVSPVVKVHFACGRASGQLLCRGFVVGTPLISAGFRGFSLRMCHDYYRVSLLIFLIRPIGDRGLHF